MTQTSPRISILSPVRNVERYISQTIDSIRAQSFSDWELLVMDGASTDGTADIVRAYARDDSRIKFFSEPDEGVAHATSKGLALARGEFVTFVCGQDGFLDREWLAKSVRAFDHDPTISLVWALSKMMADDGTVLAQYRDIGFEQLVRPAAGGHTAWLLLRKSFQFGKELLVGPPVRRKMILHKVFSRNAALRARLLMDRSVARRQGLDKAEWFHYWLRTGIPFSDQSMVVDRKVFGACIPPYEPGSRSAGYMADFYFHFNSRGYLSHFLPEYPVFVRHHPNQSGVWAQGEIQEKFEAYLRRVREFRTLLLRERRPMTFINRSGQPVFSETIA